MKKALALLLSVLLLTGLFGAARAESGEPSAEWTVMIYLCGTDLESGKFASATKNLRMIAQTVPADTVNVVIETGGAKEWHAEKDTGMKIASDRLQRWTWGKDGFTLVDEQPEACMSHADTLSAFIRWSAEHYPAKKNLLLLWDHGGGSNSGMICDENYGMTVMPVFSLERALKDGGTHFDLLATDMCLMASLEMSQAAAPYADFLAASQEIMAGDGTNYEKWLQYLYDRPDCTGKQLGKQICDVTQQYYVEQGITDTVSMFTMSVIDLSKIGAVAEATEAFMREAAKLTQDPAAFYAYARATYYVDSYLKPEMCDLYDLTRRAEQAGIPVSVTHAVQDAVDEAVVYFLRSANHSYSHGLSIWYKLNADDKTLDHFARTCKNPEQLAFLDAVSVDWEAPEWVYEKAERHPELNRSDYMVKSTVSAAEDGTKTCMTIDSGILASVFVSYELMYQDAASDICFTLGESGDVETEVDKAAGQIRCTMNFDGSWPTLAGVPLSMDMADDTETYALFNVDVRFNNQDYNDYLRVIQHYEKTVTGQDGKEKEIPEYELQGFWDGFDEHTGLPGRNIYALAQYKGYPLMLYRLAYSQELKKVSAHVDAKEITISDDMKITKEPLPEGRYLYRFVVRDVFGNRIDSGKLMPVNWDGKTVSYPAEEKKETQGEKSDETPAEQEWGIFDSLCNLLSSDALKNAEQVMERDLYTDTVNGMEFTVSEAGYDGRSLFLRCGYRIPDAETAFGVTAAEVYGEYMPAGMKPESFVEGLREAGNEFLEAKGIGWWYDQFWIDGKGVPLAVGAMQSVSGSSNPGEIIETDFLPLGKLGVSLKGIVRISLPIGTRPDRSEYDPETHPEMYDADGSLKLPDKGVITFELNTEDTLSQVRTFHPEQETDLSGFTAKAAEAAFTPFLTYITVDTAIKPGALEAFTEEHGEGETDENGEVVFRYGPIDVVTPWLESLQLTDGNGTVLFPEQGGLQEHDEQRAEFIYSYIETLPESLFLAPVDMDTGKADMDRAIPVISSDAR